MSYDIETIKDCLKILPRLISKTQEGKIEWAATDFPHRYVALLPDGTQFVISSSADGIGFEMTDGANNRLIDVVLSEQPDYGFDRTEDWKAAEFARTLYELVRRAALKIDEKVDTLTRLLDEL